MSRAGGTVPGAGPGRDASHPEGALDAPSLALRGELFLDAGHRRLYATDASHYEQQPCGVARPADADDCAALVRFAAATGQALIPRGGGTGLCGQTVGSGLVVDCSRHLDRVLALDTAGRRARVEPGVIPAELNRSLRHAGLRFAPDPSTLDRCTIGGMHATNAWGSHAPRDGSTRDHVSALELLTGGGERLRLVALSAEELRQKLAREDLEGRIYRAVHTAIDRHRELLLARAPHPEVTNNTGYALDVLARGQPWVAEGEPFNLTRLLAGAEGTLGLVTELEVKLSPLPEARGLLCLHLETLEQAFRAVPRLMALAPAALELLDRTLLALTAGQPGQHANRFWVAGDPGAVLLIEFSGEPATVAMQLAECRALAAENGCYACVDIEPDRIDRVFALRRAALGLLMGRPGRRRTATVIEDSAVPLAALGEYIGEVRALMRRLGVECMYYGSLSRGLVHLRPWLDLDDPADLARFTALPEALSDLVLRYRGAFSTKHGDGRLRAPWLEKLYGAEIVALFREVKNAFDPHRIFNPGKILDPPPLTENLRGATTTSSLPADPAPAGFDWGDGGWLRAVRQCNGAGACRARAGTMCPTYMATREEAHATRGRANLLRQVVLEGGTADADEAALAQALELCLSCKACRRECPANVDMARLKAEWTYHRRLRGRPPPLQARAIAGFARLSALASRAPGLSNRLLRLAAVRRLLGVDLRRHLPRLSRHRFSRWLRRHPVAAGGMPVILLNDPHTEYYAPHVGRAAVAVLEAAGCQVHVTPVLACARAEISQGDLAQARATLNATVDYLSNAGLPADAPVIGLEPSELLTLRDEAPALVSAAARAAANALAARARLLDEFLGAAELPAAGGDTRNALIHVHCHQKALGDSDTSRALLVRLGWRAQNIDSPCCGMAGFFGYRHYDVSLAVGELAVLPAVRDADADTVIVASGVSCRAQIEHATGRAPLHVAEAVAMALGLALT